MKQGSRRGRPPGRDTRRGANPLVRSFADRLKEWRRKEGLLLKDVAAALKVSISIVCEWELGHRFPSVDHLQAIALYTGIPAWQFLKIARG
jgi:transcriptional regulator with XRE-family HTH domain